MNAIKAWRFYLLFVILGLAFVYVQTRTEVAVPTGKPFNLFPLRVANWVMTGESHFSGQVLEVLRPSDYLSRNYQNSRGEQLGFYLGFHDGGPDSGPIHSPKQCLPGSGWNRLHDEVRSVLINGHKVPYVSAVYQKDQQKQLFLYWFQEGDEVLTNEYALKFVMIKNSILRNRRDSAFIRLSLMIHQDEAKALATGEEFMRDFVPIINTFLPI
ncbi:exosortase C-terminal domain/associated protein EpsI [Geopsychrobacter electrodiphilus]|uniref:exosortase C-terminal domain/associated protein EpsI n=1 Tax=Geopsychrobacter electrodiphilus TaxID=225196 RepID=UPI0003719BA5|nr:exosortase C-terminal domain/associated protein EpsI [Geopsychrobacter electrodiphilus]